MDHSPAGRERKSTRELQQSTVTSPLMAPSTKSGVRVLYSLRGPECYSIHYRRKACPVVEAVGLKRCLLARPPSRWVWLEEDIEPPALREHLKKSSNGYMPQLDDVQWQHLLDAFRGKAPSPESRPVLPGTPEPSPIKDFFDHFVCRPFRGH